MAKEVKKAVKLEKIINVTEYAMANKLMNSFDRAGSLIRALNEIDAEKGIVWVGEIMGIVIAKVN